MSSSSAAAVAQPAPSFAPSGRRATPWSPASAPVSAGTRIHLVGVPSQSRSRVPFILVCMAILATALVSVLLLNTSMAHGSYEERDLQAQLARLSEREQALVAALDAQSSPAELARRARELGMVQDSTPAFVRLSDGTIVGDPTPAQE